jgi:hypothetical protein
MSTELPSELLAYHAFVKSTLSNGGSIDEDATPAAFLAYQLQLNRLQAALQPSTDRFASGDEGFEIHIDELIDDALQSSPYSGDQQ